MHKMGVHMAYSISQWSDAPEHAYSLARAFTALAHAQIGRTYGIFFKTILSMHAVLSEPSLLSHVHKMGVHMAYSINQCSYAPEHACCLARAFIALAHAQNGRSYGIFFQSKLKRALASVLSCQSLYCSRICTKWAYIWYIFSVNA